ncbi:MAG: UTRA domain-containing protein, partial [Comamonadaceae bacterium]
HRQQGAAHRDAQVGRHLGLGQRGREGLLGPADADAGLLEQTLSATLAEAQVAADLGVPVGSALLAVRRLIYDDQDRPVQWLHGLYRPDRYEYEMQLSRVGGIDAKVWVSKELAAQFH